MKRVITAFGLLAIAANLLFGYILEDYLWRAAIMSSVAICIGVVLLLVVSYAKMKDAFRVSLNVLFLLFTAIQFVALIFVPAEGFDSPCYVVAIVLVLLEILLLLAANSVSKLI